MQTLILRNRLRNIIYARFAPNTKSIAPTVFSVSKRPTEVKTMKYSLNSAKNTYTVTMFKRYQYKSSRQKSTLLCTISNDSKTETVIEAKSQRTRIPISFNFL